MKKRMDIKDIVKKKYSEIAEKSDQGCGCGCGCGENDSYTVMQDDYSGLQGHVEEADLGLGCGIPTDYAGIKKGDTIVDLGSGAGNDVFVARQLTGENGKVIGIDFSEEMLEKAEKNNQKLGYKNVEFHRSDIEVISLDDEISDVVISNCVLNLVPDKEKAFAEIFRILKPEGHFCVSDIVLEGELPEGLRKSAEMYAGCVSGAIQRDEYICIIKNAGFKNVEIKKSKEIILPDNLLSEHLSPEDLESFKQSETGIYSITVVGYKS